MPADKCQRFSLRLPARRNAAPLPSGLAAVSTVTAEIARWQSTRPERCFLAKTQEATGNLLPDSGLDALWM